MGDTEQEKLIILDITGVQRYLNDKYGANSEWNELVEDGVAGYNTMVGLVRALQIEMEIDADGGFGNGTKNTFNNLFPNGLGVNTEANTQQIKNIIALINSGLMCRIEISNNTEDAYVYSNNTAQGIANMMNQLGISDFTNNIMARQVKALMTSDAYYLISNGDETTRQIQQSINRKYSDVLDNYIPTNGLYERNMNTAIIKAIQYEIGVDVDGGWGEGTKSALPILGPGSNRTNLVYILQYLLYLNGFDPNGFDGGFGNGVTTALKNFQSLMKLDSDGYCGRQAWSALVVSCGDTARSANACDTCFEITAERAQLLKENGYEIVGRYLTGYISETRPKALQTGELATILNAGLKAFVIYQDNNRQISDFTFSKGRKAALEALESAVNNRVPDNTVIYFAVDLDVYEDQINDYIVPFFRGINRYIGDKYRVGIYGPRLVCTKITENNLAVSSFVADMSSGYSCNVGQKIPSNWNYDQFKEISNFNNDMDIDKVTYSGSIAPIANLAEETTLAARNQKMINFLAEAYNLAATYNGNSASVKENNSLVIQYIAYRDYDTTAWSTLLEYDMEGINYIKNNISKDERDSTMFIGGYNKMITLPHICASLYSVLNNRTGVGTIDAIVADLTGWAGDLVQFAGEFENAFRNSIYPTYSEELITQILCDNSSAASDLGFDLEDLIQDVDVWMLYKSLRNYRIDIVFNSYYNDIVQGRGNGFVNCRNEYGHMPSDVTEEDSNYNKVYKLAKSYLTQDLSNLEGLAANAFEAVITKQTATIPGLLENVARAFATKITSMI